MSGTLQKPRELFDPTRVPLRGEHLVEASAGTGKTYSLASIYERLIDERGLAVDRVLVVTFTRAATAELRHRLRERLRQRLARLEAQGEEARAAHVLAQIRRFDLASIFTIHSFCQGALEQHAFETRTPFAPEFLDRDQGLRDEIAFDLYSRAFYRAPEMLALAAEEEKVDSERVSALLGFAARTPGLPIVYEPRGELRDTWPAPPEPCDLEPARRELAEAVESTSLSADERERVARWLAETYAQERFLKKTAPRSKVASWGRLLRELADPPDPFDLYMLRELHSDWIRTVTKKAQRDQVMTEIATEPLATAYRKLDRLGAASQRLYDAALGALPDLQLRLFQQGDGQLSERPWRLGKLTFRELILRLYEALRGDGAGPLVASLSTRFDAALIDEFQDTDPRQTFIFRTLFADAASSRPVFFVGDPKQAIYGWRGADLEAYLGERRRERIELHSLDTNYRSSPSLLRGIEQLYTRSPHAFGWGCEVGFSPVKPSPSAADELRGRAPLEIVWVGPGDGVKVLKNRKKLSSAEGSGLARLVANDISELLQGDARLRGETLRPGQVAVLVRTNKQGMRVQDALRDLGVPSVLYGNSRVVESVEAADLASVIDAVAAPSDRRKLAQAFVTSVVGLTGADMQDLLAHEERWEQQAAHFSEARRLWIERGFSASMRGLLDAVGAHANLLGLSGGERRLTNLRHLLELLDQVARRGAMGPSALARAFASMRLEDEAFELGSEALEQRLERDEEGVQIMTIHKSKGLEFDVVYCPFVATMDRKKPDSRCFAFHDPEDDQRLKLHLGLASRRKGEPKSPLVEIVAEQSYREEARLLYVALTRARQLLVTYSGPFGGQGTAPFTQLLWGREEDETCPAGAARLEKIEEHELRKELEELAQASGGSIAVRSPVKHPLPYVAESADGDELRARHSERRLSFGLRRTSYSALVRRAHESASPRPPSASSPDALAGADLERDVDAARATAFRDDDAFEAGDELSASAAPAAPSAASSAFGAGQVSPGIRLTRARLAAGPDVGTFLHSVLEHADFRDDARLDSLVEAELARAALEVPDRGVLTSALRAIFSAPLDADDPGLRLDALGREDRLDELHFEIPLAVRSALSVRSLAACFARHGAPAAWPDYSDDVAQLGFPAVRGYLVGDVDLLFRHAGADGAQRFFVVDYKSNHLGDTLDAYAPAALPAVMASHHYLLQYHLYTVAVHRHLARVVPDYDYDRHFGGAYYLFLRGMAPDVGAAPPGHGVFFDRPSRALVEDLSTLLERGAARDAGEERT